MFFVRYSVLNDFAIRRQRNAYSLLGMGRYLNHIVNYLIKLKDELMSAGVPNSGYGSKLQPVIKDIMCLIKSTSRLPSDLHISYHL